MPIFNNLCHCLLNQHLDDAAILPVYWKCDLQRTATHYSVLQCVAVCCITLLHATTHRNTLHNASIHCITLYMYIGGDCSGNLRQQHAATHCNTLQHTATHCNTLQHTVCIFMGGDCSGDLRQQHTATHCNTLQHTATHCNTLQHTVYIYKW